MKNKYVSPKLNFISALSNDNFAADDMSGNYEYIGGGKVDPANDADLFE